MQTSLLSLLLILSGAAKTSAFAPQSLSSSTAGDITSTSLNLERRQMLQIPALAILGTLSSSTIDVNKAGAATIAGASAGLLPDLPSEAVRSYLQYRIPLQIAADYYVFELLPKLSSIDDWGEVNQLFQVNNNKGQGSPSKIERDYTNTMRIIGLSMPPDEAEDMRDAQFKFERAVAKISKAVSGVRRDLPVEIDKNAVPNAKAGWEDGRVALNEFFSLLNKATGLDELQLMPAAGTLEDMTKEYGRSASRYNVLMKKTKLCQNRGGPALSQAWGQLMVSGYMQDSCGIPDLDDYFYQNQRKSS
mmetsp:Transcript_19281/g.29211  ORF Transcript_19281/g.29211 Transcript_19281/m.29211 type:complete len:304 (-) Transcript_19281:68-979(-)|eukprot:CAMPEP_0194114062 /NCGR_PEP_ID=MMETSP0150-20130528/18790_1 /TAXON_ID=122233 /ORGANISM="Chaetoceros debilis, Strain MM31A-1" /LENGTH=303 /DNA_ID=CAMNT_0038804155 /DNA_START=75 /DNA_END=986 /DNA_ORIENTATION=+